jgi:hypothetical protein
VDDYLGAVVEGGGQRRRGHKEEMCLERRHHQHFVGFLQAVNLWICERQLKQRLSILAK